MAYKFSIVKKGYNPEEVDSYIQGIESALKGYKEKEVAIKNALINAQIAADNVIRGAEEEVRKMKQDFYFQLDGVKNSIVDQRKILENFQSDYKRIARKYLIDVEENDFSELNRRIDELVDGFAASNKKTQAEPSTDMGDTKIFDTSQSSSVQDDGFRELLKY